MTCNKCDKNVFENIAIIQLGFSFVIFLPNIRKTWMKQ